jgi:hypothetical protein
MNNKSMFEKHTAHILSPKGASGGDKFKNMKLEVDEELPIMIGGKDIISKASGRP